MSFIKVHRKLLASNVFRNEKLLKVFMYCLLKATYIEYEQTVGRQTVLLKPGQFIFGRKKAALELDMKESTIRDYMNLLKYDNTLDIKSTNKYSVVTVINWGFYQGREENPDNNPDNKNDSKRTANQHKQEVKELKELNNIPFAEIVTYLNDVSGKSFKPSSTLAQKHIKARWNEKHTLEDFKKVIDVKVVEWRGTDQEMYIRPETLFGPKFEGYLNQAPTHSNKPSNKDIETARNNYLEKNGTIEGFSYEHVSKYAGN